MNIKNCCHGRSSNYIQVIAEAAASVIALLFFATYVFISIKTLNYPFQLERVESNMMGEVLRVWRGLPLYTPPSLQYISNLYTPLYYYLSALFCLPFGVDYFPARLVSFFSTLGCGIVLFAWARKEKASLPIAFVCSGLFFATFEISGRWYSLARVDSLFNFLLLYGMYLLCHYKGKVSAVWSGIVLTGAFFTKQSAVIAVIPVLLAYMYIDKGSRRFYAAGAFILPVVAGVLAFNMLTDQWFWYYIYTMPMQHDHNDSVSLAFLTKDLLPFIWPMFVLGIGMLYIMFIQRGKNDGLLYSALLTGFLGCAYIMKSHSGGSTNCLIPAYTIFALFAPLTVSMIGRGNVVRGHIMKYVPQMIAWGLIYLQFGMLIYDPTHAIPSKETYQAALRYLDYLGKIKGDVAIDSLVFIKTREDQNTYGYFTTARWDIMRSTSSDVKMKLAQEWTQAIEQKKFAAIISWVCDLPKNQKAFYEFKENILPDNSLLSHHALYDLNAPNCVFTRKP